ncbi:cupin domain-containing protein [Glycomyces xiaoerkulensis]|uniref:cupin domain-containing protein n=1 Tax=Glycomyces xiaoerkulensis TaxID=2038139 RepID=UPI000C2570F2|nr:cupin domain-containing protein [Glycomyces xiaoerkulensis]
MSYPEPKYLGETGEVSAVFRPSDQPHDLPFTSGSAEYLATGDSTDSQFGLYRWNMGARQGGPDPHFHKGITESFYILEGTVTLYNGTEWVEADEGDFLYVPQGGVHGFRNDSDEPASMLLLFTPGAPREGYFENLKHLGRMSEEERAEFFDYHDTYWVDR